MLRTGLCDLLGIDVPIVLAPSGPWDEVDLAASVCAAGALGSVGTAVRSVDRMRVEWERLRELTDRPFAINHTGRPFDEESFQATLDFRPAAISFHMGVPVDLIARAHDRGILWLQTVGDLEAAEGPERGRRRAGRPGDRGGREQRLGGDDGVGAGGR
jgi:enoyl-[acyl-carrier protein] reductase II